VQTFIYQFVILNKINRLTLKRFEQKYLLLPGFMFEVVHISPANSLFSIHIPQFIYESKSERIIEIGPHLPKLS